MDLGRDRGRPKGKPSRPFGDGTQAGAAKEVSISRRTMQRYEQMFAFHDNIGEPKSKQGCLLWQILKEREKTRIDLLAARSAVRRVGKRAERVDGLPPEEWALLRETYVEIQRLLYPE